MSVKIKNSAKLAAIAMTDEEIKEYEEIINPVIDWIDGYFAKVKNVECHNIEDIVTYAHFKDEFVSRKDDCVDNNHQQEILKNTENEQGFFKVPKYVNKSENT